MIYTQKILDGVLLLDKPLGCTSHDVIQKLRRHLGLKRIGHAGTLDPLATGLLIILVGKATKVSQYLMGLNKSYMGTIRLGVTKDTQDAEGKTLAEKPIPADLTPELIDGVFKSFIGDQYQTPPMYSAKKVNGVPLYKLARRGEEIERKPRFIHVSHLKATRVELPEIDFEVTCTKGTYVRTLANDIGEKLNCGGYLSSLRRTAIEQFSLEQALTLESIQGMSQEAIKKVMIPVSKLGIFRDAS